MPVSRMRMRPWLEAKIDSNAINGLIWINKEKKIFQIPWKHAARHGWDLDKDACLFKQWAIHTGKYKQGVHEPDPKTWKANFRCAMNSLPDIEEVKDQSVNKGCSAVRVYKMLPPVSKKRDKKSCTKETKNRNRNKGTLPKVKAEDSDYREPQLPDDHSTYTAQEEHSSEEVDSTENDLDFTDSQFQEDTMVVPSDWTNTVEISTADSTNEIYQFQVSPIHSPELENLQEVIQMAQELEQDQSQWQQSNINGKGFLSNAVGTSETVHNTESHWSDTAEVELRFYTELKGGVNLDLVSYLDPWTSNSTANLQQIVCPL
ncbi:IRF1 factor, partial [Atractosteus spatula]|nr:IRF1 factor [Atractosteus spatula]